MLVAGEIRDGKKVHPGRRATDELVFEVESAEGSREHLK